MGTGVIVLAGSSVVVANEVFVGARVGERVSANGGEVREGFTVGDAGSG